MSSLRNAVKRKTHKERAQPAERRRYGLLEKHKDYVLRARDFHRKETTLKELRLKASFRNPDEFYFRMEHDRTRKGVHTLPPSGGGKKWTEEELALMRSQDRGYILTKLQAERKKVEKLQASLHGLLQAERPPEEGGSGEGLPAQGKNHIVFVEGEGEEQGDEEEEEEEGGAGGAEWEEREAPGEDAGEGGEGSQGEDGGDGDEHAGVRRLTGKTQSGREKAASSPMGKRSRRTWNKKAAAAYRELEMRKDRVVRLSAVLQQMELQRNLAGKGRKRKLGVETESGEATTVYKWARQRQR